MVVVGPSSSLTIPFVFEYPLYIMHSNTPKIFSRVASDDDEDDSGLVWFDDDDYEDCTLDLLCKRWRW